MKIKFLITFLLAGLISSAQVSVKNLRCEMLSNPLGIDVQQPRFSWQLESTQRNVTQLSYQIIVSSNQEKLKADEGDIWNSGMINKNKSVLVSYGGKPLQSAKKYFWKVKVLTNKGEASTNETPSTEKNGWKAHMEYTTDYGKTWTKSADINDGKIVSTIQPSILQYSDGRLQILYRSMNRTINQSWSSDRGKTWSVMTASSLPNNNSGIDAVTLKNGNQLLVYNHVKPADSLPRGKGVRTPLNVAILRDGNKWYAALILEDSPVGEYSYPSVIQTKDGMVHIVYTWRRERIKHVVIDPSKLELREIVNEKWPGIEPDHF